MEKIQVPMHPVMAHNGVWKTVICNLLTPKPATIQNTIIAMTAQRTDFAYFAICRNFSIIVVVYLMKRVFKDFDLEEENEDE